MKTQQHTHGTAHFFFTADRRTHAPHAVCADSSSSSRAGHTAGQMGGKGSKPQQAELPKDLEAKLIEFFKKMDTDNSGTVDQEEATKFWGKNFAKVRVPHARARVVRGVATWTTRAVSFAQNTRLPPRR